MLIINADDWGRCRAETDAALACYCAGRINSVSAMVFMEDSERAADLAKEAGLDVGLHLNLNQTFTAKVHSPRLADYHTGIVRFMAMSKYAQLLYNPRLRKAFQFVYHAQIEEFIRLYGRPPSHTDGHQHRHLCSNMVLDEVIPRGERVRRNFSFWPGEKGLLNRAYRRLVDKRLARRYRLTDFFFSLSRCLQTKTLERVCHLARASTVELMTHPADSAEYAYLISNEHLLRLSDLPSASFGRL